MLTRLRRYAVLLALGAALAFGVGAAQAAPGALDPTFGIGGTETFPIGSDQDRGRAVVLQPDGKIVVAGDSYNGTNSDFALLRVDSHGALDSGFGTGGKVTTSIGSSTDGAAALALQPDGKIVAAGYSANASTVADFALARYNANGSLDTAFDGDGRVTTDILGSDDEAAALALQPDGKIVVAGRTYTGTVDDFAVVRYNANGSIDTGFGGGGASETPIGAGSAYPTAMALQPDGKIVVAGYTLDGINEDFAVVRYNANGSLDSSFGTNGEVTTGTDSVDEEAHAVALQPDGKIVIAGLHAAGGAFDMAIVRYEADGSLDTGFGTGGEVDVSFGHADDEASGIALQPDGRIVVVGDAFDGVETNFGVLRLAANGTLDSSFGSGGKAFGSFGKGGASPQGVVLQPDGRIVVAGFAYNGTNYDVALERFLGSTLTVTKTGSGAGAVTSSPAGISCDSTCSAPFAAVPVTLTATAQAGSVFSGWSGGGCSGTGACHLQLSGDKQVTARFTLLKTLTVTNAGRGSGAVSSRPAGISCGSTCTHRFATGSSVTLTARPSPGSRFAGWSGACSGTGSCKVTMNADHDVTATFANACVVPKLKGKRLRAAKRAITRSHCSLGKVTRAFSAHVKRGRVISQKPKPGTVRPARSKVSLKVSRGRRP